MRQHLLFSIAFSAFIGIAANAQVGIGTITPAATADITATNPTGASTNVDGILIPRVDRQRAQGMASVPNSTMIYVNSIATGTATGQAINITSTGFYYFDTTSTTWIKISTGTPDWTLTGNTGTTAGTNFLGTTDAQDLRIKTGGSDRWNISNTNSGQLQSYSLGSASLPVYSYQGDPNTGAFSPTADMYAVTTGGTERLRVNNNGGVGIGTTTPNGALDVNATASNYGLVAPRVALTASNAQAPVTNPQTGAILAGTVVYNTATAGASPNNVTPGMYYWDGTKWITFAGAAGGLDWTLTGNSGTTAGTHYIGTTDAQDLRIRTAGSDRWNISNTNSGQLQSYSLGSASLPVYSYQGDPNTGTFSPTADMYAVTTGGTERLRVNNNGGVGIGTTTPNGALDVNATANNYGFVAPRVALTASNAQAPVTNPQTGAILAGTVVYNTATAGASPNNVTPGLYYWNGSKWIAFAGSAGGLDWTLTGNSGTTAGTNFIGTTDAVDLEVFTNNTEKMRVRSDGSVGINSTGAASEKLKVTHTGAANDAINATNNDDSTGKGNALWATNSNATGIAIIGSSGATPPNVLPTTGAGISGSHVDGYGIYGVCGNGGPNTAGHNGHAAAAFALDSDNSVATSNNSAFAKIAGKDNVSPNGVLGVAQILYGGYFTGGVGSISYSYAGVLYNHNAAGTTGTSYKVIGNGVASTIIPDENNIPRVMFCPEAPEVLFEDYGVSKLTNGETYINIDKILAKSLKVDDKHPLKVFIQLEGDCNGVYVTEKSIKGFKVKELNKGNSNVSFSWHIVGTRADSKDANGKLTSEFENLRLPIGPTSLKEDKLVQKENPKTNQESNTK